jgi:hypothetical protein
MTPVAKAGKNHRKPSDLSRQPSVRTIKQIVNSTGVARAPDFFVIGAEKCGTTWLWEMFREHPDIGVSLPKELRYFANQHIGTGFGNFGALHRLLASNAVMPTGIKRMERFLEQLATELRISYGNDQAYLRVFGALKGAVVGDISPQYCMLPDEGIDHMRRLAPDAKIIFMMRDPVERAISAGKMKASEGSPVLNDERVREKALVPFQINMSRYSAALERFEDAFPGRVFAGFMDDIVVNPLSLLENLSRFLGVTFDPAYFNSLSKVANEGKRYSVGSDLKREIFEILKDEYDLLENRFPERIKAWRENHASY